MSATGQCPRRILAQSPGYRIERSTCGLIHICAGPVTLHMQPSAYESFTSVLAQAMVALAKLHEQEARPSLRLVEYGEPQPEAPDEAKV